MDLELAVKGYADCGIWSESCNGTADHRCADQCDGEDCDLSLEAVGFHRNDISTSSMDLMRSDVRTFINTCNQTDRDLLVGLDSQQVGHDFWLTRNGHGTGFWDRGLGERGDVLARLSKSYGECHLWVEDGVVVYQS